MITTKENKSKAWLDSYRFLVVGTAVIVFLVITTVAFGAYSRFGILQSQSKAPVQPLMQTDSGMYMMVQDWDGQNNVLVFSPESGEVSKRFEAGYNAVVNLTTDNSILYIYNQSHSENALQLKGAVSAIDTHNNVLLWQVVIPGEAFGPSTRNAWLSSDEQRLYLMGSPDQLHPHIFAIDTTDGSLLSDFELPLPYPSNEDQAMPYIWKLPWKETLIVVSRDQLFTFDLTSGRISDAIQLFGSESIDKVPTNLPRTTFVWNGTINSETQQLLLATSTQEILAVELNTDLFTVKSVTVLPDGWQFAVRQPFLYHPGEKAVYIQVRSSDAADIYGGLIVEEIWRYDTTTWKQTSQLGLRDYLAQIPSGSKDDLTNYGLALSSNGQAVYSFTPQGLLRLNQEPDLSLRGTWLAWGEVDTDFVRLFAMP